MFHLFPYRKPDRERTEDLNHGGRDCNYFGLSPEERREKQAIEESRSLYEIQQRDEQAFPALSNVCVFFPVVVREKKVASDTPWNRDSHLPACRESRLRHQEYRSW